MAKELTPVEAFLAPLAKIARTHRDIEGLVFWGGSEGWDLSPSEALEAEEITFYAEGLLIDGFHMDWALVAEGGAPDHLRLCFWQDGPPPPAVAAPWRVEAEGRWVAV
ncbi:MAG: hypothetical protein ACK47C_06830 [Paracoccaceae bacterium]